MGRPLYSEEAWWTTVGLWDTRCAVPGLVEQRGAVVGVPGVWWYRGMVDPWCPPVVWVRVLSLPGFTVFYGKMTVLTKMTDFD